MDSDAQTKLDEAQTAYQNGDFGKAQALFESAANQFAHDKNQRGLAAALTNYGAACAATKAYPKAIELLELAITHHEATGELEGLAFATYSLATTFLESGQLHGALNNFEKAESLFDQLDAGHNLKRSASEIAQQIRASLPAGLSKEELERRDRLHGQLVTADSAGDTSYQNRNYSQAVRFWSVALEASLALEYDERTVGLMSQIATALCKTGDFERGQDLFRKALSRAQEVGDPFLITLAQNNLGCLLLDLGETEESADLLRDSLRSRRNLGDESHLAESLVNSGVAEARLGRFESAVKLFEDAHRHFSGVGNRAAVQRLESEFLPAAKRGEDLKHVRTYPAVDQLTAAERLSKAQEHIDSGEFEEAIEQFERVINEARGANDRAAEALSLIGLGFANRRLGRTTDCLLAYHQALSAAREAKNKTLEARSLNNLGTVYADTDQETAKCFLRAAVQLREQLDNPQELGESLSCLATLSTGSEARLQAERALNLIDPDKNATAWYSAYSALQDLMSEEEKDTMAKQHQSSLAKIGKDSLQNAADNQRLEILHDTVELGPGYGIVVAAPEEKYQTPSFDAGKKIAKAEFLWETSARSEAIEELKTVLQELVNLSRSAPTDEQRSSFIQSHWFAFDTLLSYLLMENRIDEGIEILEQVKAGSLSDILADYELLSDTIPDDTKHRYRRLQRQRRQTIDELVELQKEAWRGENSAVEQLRGELSFIMASLEEVSRRCSEYDPSFVPGSSQELLKLDEILRLVRSENHGIIAFWLGELVTGAFIISQSKIEFVALDPVADADKELEILQDILDDAQLKRNELVVLLEQLYQRWLAPLEPTLKSLGLDKLTIVPHRLTHLVPFHALTTSETQHSIDRYEFDYAPSLALLKMITDGHMPVKPSSSVVVVANPDGTLPYAEVESREISTIFKRADVLLGAEASSDKVLDHLPNSTIAHFACHASFGESEETEIALTLAPSQNHNGRLSLREIAARADLRTGSIVVLSGCRSGRTKLGRTDEFVGLPSGFILAGARTVVGSLWPVDDLSTALFMRRYYSLLIDGVASSTAIRQSQTWLRNLTVSEIRQLVNEIDSESSNLVGVDPSRKRFAHPYYWAPFFSIGK